MTLIHPHLTQPLSLSILLLLLPALYLSSITIPPHESSIYIASLLMITYHKVFTKNVWKNIIQESHILGEPI